MNKIPFFYKSYLYNLDPDISIEELLLPLQRGGYGSLKLKKRYSDNHCAYKYLISSRAGEILVFVEKKVDKIEIFIREGLFGFFLPVIFGIFSTIAFIKQVNEVGFLLLLGFCIFFCLILFSFKYYTKQIIKKIEYQINSSPESNKI
ncbi:MAG: hypothetical protein AB8E82_06785 [Aureispira sp.]